MSTLRTNALEGVDAKNSITIVAGTGNVNTTNVQQGLAKVWALYRQSDNSTYDDFNISSTDDDTTGQWVLILQIIWQVKHTQHKNFVRYLMQVGLMTQVITQ